MLANAPVFSFDTWGFVYNNENVEGKVENVMEIKNLDIDVGLAELYLTTGSGDDIDIRTENTKENCFKYRVSGDTLKISYNTNFIQIFGIYNGAKIYVTIPENIQFEDVKVHNGVGTMSVSGINAHYLEIGTGTGAAYFDVITADKIKVDSGVGELKITNAVAEELNMDSGVGKTTYQGEVHGDIDIDSGVGEVVLTLKGDESDYRFNIDKGLGDVSLNGNSCSGNFGSGKYTVKIDSGVGAVRITVA